MAKQIKSAKIPKHHGRRLWIHQGHRPGDPPYGNPDKWEQERESQSRERDRMEIERERKWAQYPDSYSFFMATIDGSKDLSKLEVVANCPMCGGVMHSPDQEFFKCHSRKCGYEASAESVDM